MLQKAKLNKKPIPDANNTYPAGFNADFTNIETISINIPEKNSNTDKQNNNQPS